MIDSEDYPFITIAELAHALGPREVVYTSAAELGAIRLRLPDNDGKLFLRV
jgi:hypothetical protein